MSVTLFSLDDPAAVSPDTAFSPETQVPWCLTLGDLPAAPDGADDSGFDSYQQPGGTFSLTGR